MRRVNLPNEDFQANKPYPLEKFGNRPCGKMNEFPNENLQRNNFISPSECNLLSSNLNFIPPCKVNESKVKVRRVPFQIVNDEKENKMNALNMQFSRLNLGSNLTTSKFLGPRKIKIKASNFASEFKNESKSISTFTKKKKY